MTKIINSNEFAPVAGTTQTMAVEFTNEPAFKVDLDNIILNDNVKSDYKEKLADHLFHNYEFMKLATVIDSMDFGEFSDFEEMQYIADNMYAYISADFGTFSTDYYYDDCNYLVIEISGKYEGDPFGYTDADVPMNWREYPYLAENDYYIKSDVNVSDVVYTLNYMGYSEDIHKAMADSSIDFNEVIEVLFNGERRMVEVTVADGTLYFQEVEED